jgi:hypothetical protein
MHIAKSIQKGPELNFSCGFARRQAISRKIKSLIFSGGGTSKFISLIAPEIGKWHIISAYPAGEVMC